MSQRNRRVLAAVGLTTALTLALPSPSQAVGLWRGQAPDLALAARAWSWLEALGLIPRRPTVPARQPANVREKQGSAIDPNGRTARIAVSTDPTLFSDQGSAIDPNGED
jgi:hypothetical protein